MFQGTDQADWPDERKNHPERGSRWLHSDVKDVAYRYNYRLWKKWVEIETPNTP
jgi:hypothetical protein